MFPTHMNSAPGMLLPAASLAIGSVIIGQSLAEGVATITKVLKRRTAQLNEFKNKLKNHNDILSKFNKATFISSPRYCDLYRVSTRLQMDLNKIAIVSTPEMKKTILRHR